MKSEEHEAVEAALEQIVPVLAAHSTPMQGLIVAELLATYLATLPVAKREPILTATTNMARELAPVIATQIYIRSHH